MDLSTADGTVLTLTILGYEFPDIIDVQYDSNWLVVGLDVQSAAGRWTTTDACLLTYEAHRLADWLEGVASGAVTNGCGFMEPCLRFESIPGLDGTSIQVILDHEFRPPWATAHAAPDDGYRLEFALASADLQAAATALRRDLMPYPQRAAR